VAKTRSMMTAILGMVAQGTTVLGTTALGTTALGTTALGTAALGAAAVAQDAPAPDIDVVVIAPGQGSAAERDRVPVNTQVLRRDALERTGPASALRALDEQVGGVALDQAQGNAFQPNLIYRGYEASPLTGNPQGLAVYLNGTRFNQSFGDTTNWDLIPDIAIDRIDLSGSNPAFGLNALGGALNIRLRDGFSYHGAALELSGGSFGRIEGSAQYGVQSGGTSTYIAGTALNEDGWRDHSPSHIRRIYGDLGWRGERAELHASLLGADNNLVGNGTTPVELLAVSRGAVFTYPDETRNRYLRLNLTGTYEVSESLSLQAAAYYSNLSQRTSNGNASDSAPCPDTPGFLCVRDGTPYTLRGGDPLPDFLAGGPYSQLDQTATDSNGFGASAEATHRSEILGRANRLLAGASFDGGRTSFSARSTIGQLTPDRGFAGPGLVISQADGSITPVRLAAGNDYYGVFASDSIDVTSSLTVTVSGRLNVAQLGLRDRNGTALSGDHGYARFNPAAGLTYKVTPDLSVYGGFADSNRTPTPAELSCASNASPCSLTNFFVADPTLKQVVARTYETGVRGKFLVGTDARVSWNAGVFRTDSDDDILFTTSVVQGRGFFQNVGSTRRQGVEAGVDLGQGRLRAFASYALTDATFRKAFIAGTQNNPFADANGNIQVRPGNQIPGIPEHSLKFGAQYDITARWTSGLTGIARSGRTLQGDASNQNPRTGAYVVLNLNTSYRVTDNIELFGLVQNLTNARYATYGGFSPVSLVPIAQAPGATNPRSLTPGEPVAGFAGVRVTL